MNQYTCSVLNWRISYSSGLLLLLLNHLSPTELKGALTKTAAHTQTWKTHKTKRSVSAHRVVSRKTDRRKTICGLNPTDLIFKGAESRSLFKVSFVISFVFLLNLYLTFNSHWHEWKSTAWDPHRSTSTRIIKVILILESSLKLLVVQHLQNRESTWIKSVRIEC